MGSGVRPVAPGQDRVRHPAVPGCQCPARLAPLAGSRARAAARTCPPGREDPLPAQAGGRLARCRGPARFGRRTAGQNPDRHGAAACPRSPPGPAGQAGRRAAPRPLDLPLPATGQDQFPREHQARRRVTAHRADQRRGPGGRRYPEFRADQHQDPCAGRWPEPRGDRCQNPCPGRRPEPGARLHQDPCAGPHREPRAGRSQHPSWCQKRCGSPRQERRADQRQHPDAGRCPGPVADPRPGWSRGWNGPPRADPAADPDRLPCPGQPRRPCACRRQGADPHRYVGRRQGAGRRGAGRRGAGRHSAAGQPQGGEPPARPAGIVRRDRPGHPGQDLDRCRWRTGASAVPERDPNRCRSCSLSSPRTPRWLAAATCWKSLHHEAPAHPPPPFSPRQPSRLTDW